MLPYIAAFTSCKWFVCCLYIQMAIRLPARLKCLVHSLQANGFSPVCIFMCRVRTPVLLNCLLHSLHVNGFSPVCIFVCLNCLLHSLHVNGFSAVCILMAVQMHCCTKLFASFTACKFFLLCVFSCGKSSFQLD